MILFLISIIIYPTVLLKFKPIIAWIGLSQWFILLLSWDIY